MSDELALTPADLLAWVLEDRRIGRSHLDPGDWPVWVSGMPDEPDNAIAVYDTDPLEDGRLMEGETLLHPGVQVQVRGTDRREAHAKMEEVRVLCDKLLGEVVTTETQSWRIQEASITSGPVSLGREEETRRYIHTINVLLTLDQLS